MILQGAVMLVLTVATVAPNARLGAQSPHADDPYTRGRPELLAKLGYVATGPFPLGDGHGSADVDEFLGRGRMRWVETAHFRIGTDLDTRPLPGETRERRGIYAACRQLHARLRAIPGEPKELDPWLHLHLLASLTERLYGDFSGLAGVSDAWFRDHAVNGEVGAGPNLGRPEKFVLLVFEREADLARYLRRFCSVQADQPWMLHFPRQDNFLFATAASACRGLLQEVPVLHGHVVHGMTQNLIDALCGEDHVPFWLREGLAHWLARKVDERLVDITNAGDEQAQRFADWDWTPKVRKRMQQDLEPDLADVFVWYDGRGRDLADHAMIWSLVDFLAADGKRFALLCQFARQHPMRSRYMPRQMVLDWHEDLLRATGTEGAGALAKEWRDFVLTRYRGR